MNIKNLILAVSSFVVISSCSKEDLKINFDLGASEINFEVKASPQAGAMQIDAQNMQYNLDSVCKANSISKDQIKSVKIKEVFLDILDNKTTFDIIDWAEAYVGASGKANLLLASKNPVLKDGVRTISLDLKDVELVEYIQANQMSFFAKGATNSPILTNVPMRARVKFSLTAQVVK
ncbi:MAG: hypothetical protein HYZ42_03015 [Bacteroidetes bacterium]|nr:hypothetical protein [Bacteroidota bacterium]